MWRVFLQELSWVVGTVDLLTYLLLLYKAAGFQLYKGGRWQNE